MLHPYYPPSKEAARKKTGYGLSTLSIWLSAPSMIVTIIFYVLVKKIDFEVEAYKLANYIPILLLFVLSAWGPLLGAIFSLTANFIILFKTSKKWSLYPLISLGISIAAILAIVLAAALIEKSAYKLDYIQYLEPYLAPYLNPVLEPIWNEYLVPYLGTYPYA
jgi:hypothetical protein